VQQLLKADCIFGFIGVIPLCCLVSLFIEWMDRLFQAVNNFVDDYFWSYFVQTRVIAKLARRVTIDGTRTAGHFSALYNTIQALSPS